MCAGIVLESHWLAIGSPADAQITISAKSGLKASPRASRCSQRCPKGIPQVAQHDQKHPGGQKLSQICPKAGKGTLKQSERDSLARGEGEGPLVERPLIRSFINLGSCGGGIKKK